MKKFLVLIVMASIFCFPALAQGNVEVAEKLSILEGTIELLPNPGGAPAVDLVAEDGTKTELVLSKAALQQLGLQSKQRIRVEGVLLGQTAENKVQQKLFVRAVVINQVRQEVLDPVKLAEQERKQLKAYEKEQSMLQVQQKTQTNTEQGGAPESSGGGSGKGKN